ncbi:glycoside hydrolase family 10 protein [Nocardiopsis tropica]|uniref:Family 10 glycosylhydrolase n=1 Tax=Nocardiopsis tropica TaxID=109330 RepID=A0ABU7L1J4_9ACTN|nr:family 10 glycosylhydrolase [Nocardiopsis umidischolae]MEE2055192.1 family 10 glycosylhydrolase [Nocardiopsis umidischolae]
MAPRWRNRWLAAGAAAGLMLSAYVLVGATDPGAGPGAARCQAAHDKREMRGAWLTTVGNIDWPSEPGLSADEQRAEMDERLDEADELGLNTVFLHVRPTADAVYESDLEPWSRYLTGEQGGDPGYDPLEYAVEQAHLRGLELHAWFNPYRVGLNSDIEEMAEDHPVKDNPDWLVEYGGEGFLDPGNPEVREWVTGVIMDVVERYDIDGVHFDDFFYPYPKDGEEFDDDASWDEHGDGFDDREDWRRDNVNRLVEGVHDQIQDTEPWVRFGISPFGIWRNDGSDPTGSATSGLESYAAQHADTRTWIREGMVDYVVPQLYWERGFGAADYEELVPWWASEVEGTGVDLYIGQAAYRVGESGWREDDALSTQLDYSDDFPEVGGDVYFSFTSLTGAAEEAYEHLAEEHYADPALPPVADPSREGQPLTGAVTGLTATADGDGDGPGLEWDEVDGARSYAVYRLDPDEAALVASGDTEDRCEALSADNLVEVTGRTSLEELPSGEDAPEGTAYAVTALDDYRVEGPVGALADPRG